MAPEVNTVLGPVPASALGRTMMHEHLFVDLVRAGEPGPRWELPITLENLPDVRRSPNSYRANLLMDSAEEALQELADFKAVGGGCIVDATSRGIGRDPARLRQVSREAGVHVVMGSGYYVYPHHPADIAERAEEAIAEEIISDLTVGVDGVVAGLIGEIGLSWPTHPDESKVLRAAVRAQVATGAPISIHPARSPQGPLDAAQTVVDAGGDPARSIICHLDGRLQDFAAFDRVAATGCYLEIDLFGCEGSHFPGYPDFDMPNDGTRVRQLLYLCEKGLEHRLLVSSDMAMKFHRSRYGGWGYAHLIGNVVPLMMRRGIPATAVEDILVTNPARVLGR
jgi:phosphotriesterase-related protein